MTHRKAQGMINRHDAIYVQIILGGVLEWVQVKKWSAKRALRFLYQKGIRDFTDHIYKPTASTTMLVIIPD